MDSDSSMVPAYRRRAKGVRTQPAPFDDPEPVVGESAAWVVRTALCVQPRQGRLYVFMPPIASLEGYLELIAAIEATAAATGFPVVIEGYAPPPDPRVKSLKVTPDPGVIEVNIQPMHSWREMVDGTTALYETARQTRLGTEKFMLDGRHTGTAAAIISSSAAPPRPTAPSCAVRICCAAWSPSGTIIPP
jgi:uncharacterized protein (DUF2126 family)